MERGRPPGDSYSQERPAGCRRALSVCDSLDVHGAPADRAAAALQAALCAAREQPARPRSVCSGASGRSPAGPRSLLLGLLRPRLGRRGPADGPPPAPGPEPAGRPGSAASTPASSPAPSPAPARRSRPRGSPAPRPTSMTFLEVNRLELAAAEGAGAGLGRAGSAGFLRGASLWSSQRWQVLRGGGGPGPRRGLSALRKSFSFRLRRGQEIRRAESGPLPRARTRSDGDASSLGAFPSRRDLLLGAEAPRAAPEPGRPRAAAGLWRLLTSRFRRREPAPAPAPAEPLWSRRAAAAPGLLGTPSGKGKSPSLRGLSGRSPALRAGAEPLNLPGRGGGRPRLARGRWMLRRALGSLLGVRRWSWQRRTSRRSSVRALAAAHSMVGYGTGRKGPFLTFGTCRIEARKGQTHGVSWL